MGKPELHGRGRQTEIPRNAVRPIGKHTNPVPNHRE